MRSVFDIHNLNLTEFARSFGLYKELAGKVTIATKRHDPSIKDSKKKKDHGKKREVVNAGTEEAKLYTKRLLKAKQKEIERKLYTNQSEEVPTTLENPQKDRLEYELKRVKREVYVNEWKVE